jgi:hypothetical protein
MKPLSCSSLDGARRLATQGVDSTPGRPVALRGFNLSGSAKDRRNGGLPFGLRGRTDLVSRAREFLPGLAADGFDLLRIPIVWEFLQTRESGTLNGEVARELREFVRYAGALEFRIIIDIHQDALGSYFARRGDPSMHGDGLPEWVIHQAYDSGGKVPRQWADGSPFVHSWGLNYALNCALRRSMRGLSRPPVLASFAAFASQLAGVFAGLDNILTYEVLNEPYSPCVPVDHHAKLAGAVRGGLAAALAPGGQTPTWSVMPAGDWLDGHVPIIPLPRVDTNPDSIRQRSSLPEGDLREMLGDDYWLLTPHFYDPRADTPLPLEAEPGRYDAVVQAAAGLFDKWGVVPVVGEFGCPASDPARDGCHQAWIDAFEQRCWSWCLWNFNPDAGPGGDDHWCRERYSVVESDGDGKVVLTDAYRALLRPFPRSYGAPLLGADWDGRRYSASLGKAFRAGWRTDIFVPTTLGTFRAHGPCEVRDRWVVVDTDAGDAEVTIELDA